MRLLRIIDNKIVPKFSFDPDIVAKVRSIDGRKWNADLKRWEIPIDNLSEVIEKLLPLGFSASHEVVAMKAKVDEVERQIDRIRSGLHIENFSDFPLFDFQKVGASFIKQMPYCLLADVPGLGKSLQTIAGTLEEEKILILCPASLKYSWSTEIEKWCKGAGVVVIDGDKEERTALWERKSRYYIANYELLLHDFESVTRFCDENNPVIVCDEATRISNPEAKTVVNLKKLKAKKRIALTGTPISNRPDDIWSIMDWVSPGYLGGWFQFRNKYCDLKREIGFTSGKEYTTIVGYKNLDELSKKVGRFMMRRTKEEVFNDFPKKTIENVVVQLSKEERELYTAVKQIVREEIHRLSDLDTRSLPNILVKMLRLKQTTDHPKLVESDLESSKLNTLLELIDPIMKSGEKIIVFTQFSEMMDLITESLQKKNYMPFCIYGEVDSAHRMKLVQEFNNLKGPQIIVMTEAGAYGLNMQSASYVVHYDLPWSIAKVQQREDRAHRIGQDKPVTVYNMVAKDTIDEYVAKVIMSKSKVSANILKDAERMAEAGLSQEDIDAILRL